MFTLGVLRKPWIALPIAALVLAALAFTGVTQANNRSSRSLDTGKVVALHSAMDKLWEDHITWTRMVIMGVAAGSPDVNAAVDRLLQNQTDIGNAVKPFYGDATGNQLTALLRDHILIAADLLNAAKAGDTPKFNDAKGRWYANADDIATFLSNANPKNWPLDEMKAHMGMHLDTTLDEAVARLSGDWTGDVAAYDKVHSLILDLSETLSDGLVAQFPGKFSAGK